MAPKKITAKPNPRTGSYTGHVPQSTRTGTFAARSGAATKSTVRGEQSKSTP